MRSAFCIGWPLRRLRQFFRDDRGNISVFALTLMVAMIGIGGLALDTMRYEQQRVQVQNALDRCTLMAASLRQRLVPSQVVYDCMDNASLKSTVKSVVVTDSFNDRSVDAIAQTNIDTLFPNAVGIRALTVDARSKAVHKLAKIEIVLVLDVSGSMAGTKLTNLKNAAREFVATVLNGDTNKRVSISLVPYNGQVNLGPTLRGLYNATDLHGTANVNCIDLPPSVYSTLSLSLSLPMPMTGHVDTYTGTLANNAFVSPTDTAQATPTATNSWCPASTTNIVRVAWQDIPSLQTAINNLTAIGATSTNAGMRWGLAMLDPGSQSLFSSLIASGTIGANLAGRPYSYTEPESMKIIVLMTDGAHFAEERLNDGYRSGLSPIYRAADGNYSIFHSTQTSVNKFYVPHQNIWRATPYQSGTTTPVQQTWPQVWAAMRVTYVAQQFYARAFPGNSTFSLATMTNTLRTQTPTTTMDNQLQSLCTLAKGQNVIVYSIAFEAPAAAKTQLSRCASSAAHFFDAAGLQIASAFRMIATNITQLKLTL
jgi:hypothetical protein